MEILVIALILLTTSCTTTKVEIKREIPLMLFPSFPVVDGEFLEEEESVKISLDDYTKLAKFKIDYDGLIEYYNKLTTLESSSPESSRN